MDSCIVVHSQFEHKWPFAACEEFLNCIIKSFPVMNHGITLFGRTPPESQYAGDSFVMIPDSRTGQYRAKWWKEMPARLRKEP